MGYETSVLESSPIPVHTHIGHTVVESLDTMTDELALYEFLAKAKDVRAFISRIHTLVHRAGFSDFSHMVLQPGCDVQEQVGTYPKKNKELYIAEESYRFDLMLQHALLSDKPILQSEVNAFISTAPIENELFDRNRAIYKMMQSFGMYEYYNIPFLSHSGQGKALFCVVTRGGDPANVQRQVEKYSSQLSILAKAVDHIGSQKYATHFPRLRSRENMIINARPLQLLDTLANHNVTLNEAAEMLNISISTANQQIAAAKRAMGANTTASAIIQALKLGLIRIDKR